MGVQLVLLLLILQLPSKVDGTVLDIPICNTDTQKLHWDGNAFICIASSGGGTSSPIPQGAILLIETGSCPTEFTETLNGKFLLGTTNANADVGTTGGVDNIIPTGSNSTVNFTPTGTINTPTFTGNALATHQHELPFQLVSGTSIRHIAAATFGTGTSRAAIGGVTATANTTSAAVAKDQPISAGTPSGSISTPLFTGAQGTIPAQTFTGIQFDNRPSFTKVIFCKKS